MTISRMAIEASRAYIYRSETLERTRRIGVEVLLKEVFTFVEGSSHTRILHGERWLLVCCG